MAKSLMMLASVFVIGAAVLLGRANQDVKSADFRPLPLKLQTPAGFAFGNVVAVATDAEERIYVFHRGKNPVAVFDKAGAFVRTWGDGLIKTPHGLRIDAKGNVWTTDVGHHLVMQFESTGKVLLTLGVKGKPGETESQFNQPADIAFGKNGDVYIADGYGNSRVVQFTSQGKFLRAWGKRGKGPGEFNLPHTLAYDPRTDRLFVGDRSNKRVQVFDPAGKFLFQWAGTGAPYGMAIHGERMYLVDGPGNTVRQLTLDGKVLAKWGVAGAGFGNLGSPHGIWVDSNGHLYVAEAKNQRMQKFATP